MRKSIVSSLWEDCDRAGNDIDIKEKAVIKRRGNLLEVITLIGQVWSIFNKDKRSRYKNIETQEVKSFIKR